MVFLFFFLELYGAVILQLTYFQLWPKMKKVGRATFLLCVNNCDRISATFYIPTTNQCLIIFTNHIQILFLDLWLLKLTLSKVLKLDAKISPYFKPSHPINSPPYFYKKNWSPPLKGLIWKSLKIFIPRLLRRRVGEREGAANYGFIYRNKYPPFHFILAPWF